MARYVRTSKELAAPPEAVWRVLVDFDSYPKWNPLIRKVEGAPNPGGTVTMTIARPDKNGAIGRMKVRFVEWQAERALAWRGTLWPFFDATHWFRLSRQGGGTLLEHGEDMRGLYPLLLGERGTARFVPHYQALNDALAARLAVLGTG